MYIFSKESNSITKIWITLLPLLERADIVSINKEYLKDIINTPALARKCIYALSNQIISQRSE